MTQKQWDAARGRVLKALRAEVKGMLVRDTRSHAERMMALQILQRTNRNATPEEIESQIKGLRARATQETQAKADRVERFVSRETTGTVKRR